jgi:hypothetical protein
MLRSLVAIVAGFLFTGVGIILTTGALHTAFADVYPPPPLRLEAPAALAMELSVVALFAIAGCWLAARLAPARPMRHALILGALAFAVGIPNTISAWAQAPAWYHLLHLVLVLPFAWVGGRMRQLQLGQAA